MGRYATQTTDKAEQLELWVKELAEETNRDLGSSQLYAVSLCIRAPFEVNKQKYYNGFVGMHVHLVPKEPNFLTERDKVSWYSRMEDIVKKRFELNPTIEGLEYASISFEEESEEELYSVTPKKEATIRTGFNRIKEFVKWYCSAVEGYEGVVKAHNHKMLEYFENLSKDNFE